jgi:hypothetical protein
MATVLTLPIISQPAGVYLFGPATVPLGVVRATAKIDRVPLVSATLRIDWTLELSQDAGVTWLQRDAAGTVGGSVINPRTGLPFTVSSFTQTLPNPTNANRRVRGSVTINEVATTTLTLDMV